MYISFNPTEGKSYISINKDEKNQSEFIGQMLSKFKGQLFYESEKVTVYEIQGNILNEGITLEGKAADTIFDELEKGYDFITPNPYIQWSALHEIRTNISEAELFGFLSEEAYNLNLAALKMRRTILKKDEYTSKEIKAARENVHDRYVNLLVAIDAVMSDNDIKEAYGMHFRGLYNWAQGIRENRKRSKQKE